MVASMHAYLFLAMIQFVFPPIDSDVLLLDLHRGAVGGPPEPGHIPRQIDTQHMGGSSGSRQTSPGGSRYSSIPSFVFALRSQ